MEEERSSTSARIEPRDLIVGDPLLRRLMQIKAPPILIGVTYSVVFYAVRGFVAWRAGNLRTSGSTVGFFDDPAMYTNVVAGAIIWTYYVWMPTGIAGVFNALYHNRVVGGPLRGHERRAEAYRSFTSRLQEWFGMGWWPIGLLGFAVVAVAFLVAPQYVELGDSAYWTADPLSLILSLLWIMAGLYCTLLLLSYSILEVCWLSRLFNEFQIYVRPLDPDGAGGLAPIGRFNLKVSYLIALVGIMFVMTPLTRNYVVAGTWQFRWTEELLVGIGVYALASPIAFFAPLGVAHKQMKEAKNQLLLRIARRFEVEYAVIQSMLCLSPDSTPSPGPGVSTLNNLQPASSKQSISSRQEEGANLKGSLEILRELQALHKTTDRFPVWPFNVSSLTRFATSYLSPVVLAIIIDLVTGLVAG